MLLKYLPSLVTAVAILGCGTVRYDGPSAEVKPDSNSVTVDEPFEQVWSHAIPQIGKSFFVINNLDKSSGILSISYSGDPESYIDCGSIHSEIGANRADFSAAKAQQRYMAPVAGRIAVADTDRRMALEGRVNIIFEKISPTLTRITVNTRYIVTQTIVSKVVGDDFHPSTTDQSSVAFNTDGRGSAFSDGTVCRPNGKFEAEVVALVK